ncbi:MAG: Electron transfer flavoprotein-ubiquinone oxidoreductase [Flavobacteriaceae bacterium]|nr:MAG: Electron transfer flavoprotein-ubiquinone oxidoreductase [Flavobacteriaceae bacterium]
MDTNTFDVIVIGGGAAGFFAAINLKTKAPNLKIAILERGSQVLAKVKISGGGRCNVTHAEFMPRALSKNYPRGEKELLGPFHTFMTSDTLAWFEERGVHIKMEEDGRMFPVSNTSQTIIDCFLNEIYGLGVALLKEQPVKEIHKLDNSWSITTPKETFLSKKIVVATGSNPKIWNILSALNHTIVAPVASLFTFNIKDQRILDLPGVSSQVGIQVMDQKAKVVLQSQGPLLITHWGMSGPAILKLSAWGARILEALNYNFTIVVNWLIDHNQEDVLLDLLKLKLTYPKQTIAKYPQFDIPRRLWQSIVNTSGITPKEIWADIPKNKLKNLAQQLTQSYFEVSGKSTFKEEFVTAGGVALEEINFKTFESKIHPTLYFAGEVINVDAITGGFNFQNAWTSSYIVSKAISQSLQE